MRKVRTIVSLVLIVSFVFTQVTYAGIISDAYHQGYQAGVQHVQHAAGVVNGFFAAVGAAISGAWQGISGVVHGVAHAIGAVIKGAWNFVKNAIIKAHELCKKIVQGLKNYFHSIAEAYHNGYNSVAGGGGRSAAVPERMPAYLSENVEVTKSRGDSSSFSENFGKLIAYHREARAAYQSKKPYQALFDKCVPYQKALVNQVAKSIDNRSFEEFVSFMSVCKAINEKMKMGNFQSTKEDILCVGPCLKSISSKLKGTLPTLKSKEEQKLFTTMLEETEKYLEVYTGTASKFYRQGAVNLPNLR